MATWAKTVGSPASHEFENIEILQNPPEGWSK